MADRVLSGIAAIGFLIGAWFWIGPHDDYKMFWAYLGIGQLFWLKTFDD